MKVNDIIILARHYDPHADGYLVLGQNKKKNSLKKFTVGWVSRHEEKTLIRPFKNKKRHFIDQDSAHECFQDIISEELHPDHDLLTKDWQQNDVYKWEEDFIYPYAKTMTKKDILALVRKVAKDYGIKTPKIAWLKPPTHSNYDNLEHEIELGHRENVAVLHEMAHAVHEHTHDREVVAHHPPAFVWAVIELYNRYTDLDFKYLITTANNRDLLGDMEESLALDAKKAIPVPYKHVP